jgi:hypothetical protein
MALDLRQLDPNAKWAQLRSSLDGGSRSLPGVAVAWRLGVARLGRRRHPDCDGPAGREVTYARGAALLHQRRHLRRTVRIALVVGVVLTAINQLDVIVGGDATTATWVKCGLNFLVPFVVSNLGLLSGRARQ